MGQEFGSGFAGWFWLEASPGHGQNVSRGCSHVRVWLQVEGSLARCLPHATDGGTLIPPCLGPQICTSESSDMAADSPQNERSKQEEKVKCLLMT